MTNNELAELIEEIAVNTESYYKQDVLRTARDRLRDEWIPIDEFLENPVEGLCFVSDRDEVKRAYYNVNFWNVEALTYVLYIKPSCITHVMPIKKPELPIVDGVNTEEMTGMVDLIG